MEEQTINQSGSSGQENDAGYGYEGNLFEQMGYDLCERCHIRKIDRSENPKSVLCKDCREELIKLKVPPLMIGAGVLVAVIVLLCVGMFTVDIVRYKMGSDGFVYESSNFEQEASEDDQEEASGSSGGSAIDEKRRLEYQIMEANPNLVCQAYAEMADMGMVVTALDDMLDDLEEDPDDLEMAVTLVDVAMKYSYPNYAAYAMDTYLAGKSVSDDVYDRISGYYDELEIYYNTCDLIDEIWESFSEDIEALGEDGAEEDYMQLIQICHDEIEEYLGMEEYDQALLYYDLAYICQDEEERVEHLWECVGYDENYYDAQAQLGTYYRRQGDLERARTILEASYLVNREAYPVLRSLATLELVEGNLEQGLDFAQQAYDLYEEGDYVADTYLVALIANGEMEKAETLIREWENKGYIFDDDFYSFQMGDMTLEEYYIGD